MNTIVIIIAVIIILLIITMLFKIITRKPKSLYDKIMENPVVKEQKKLFDMQCEMIDNLKSATDQDEIPSGIGEFGYEVTNPIPTRTTYGNISYLAGLKTLKGEKVKYERLGSTNAENIENPIDIYKISDSTGEICTLYISMYHKINSKKAPRNFILH